MSTKEVNLIQFSLSITKQLPLVFCSTLLFGALSYFFCSSFISPLYGFSAQLKIAAINSNPLISESNFFHFLVSKYGTPKAEPLRGYLKGISIDIKKSGDLIAHVTSRGPTLTEARTLFFIIIDELRKRHLPQVEKYLGEQKKQIDLQQQAVSLNTQLIRKVNQFIVSAETDEVSRLNLLINKSSLAEKKISLEKKLNEEKRNYVARKKASFEVKKVIALTPFPMYPKRGFFTFLGALFGAIVGALFSASIGFYSNKSFLYEPK